MSPRTSGHDKGGTVKSTSLSSQLRGALRLGDESGPSSARPRALSGAGDSRTAPNLSGKLVDLSKRSARASNSNLASPRASDGLAAVQKTWGVALRDYYASGVTLPPAVSHMVTAIKQHIQTADATILFVNLPADEDLGLRGLLEFGDSVPPATPIDKVCKALLSYLTSLPEPVVLEDAALLLVEALEQDDQEYQLQSVRGVLQSLPYNHRVLLQLLVQLMQRLEQAKWSLDGAVAALATALFPGSVAHASACALMRVLMASSDTFPSSNLMIQYQVEKGSGLMLTKSAEQSYLVHRLLHRFTQEQRTVSALLSLHALWIPKADLLAELALQHSQFATAGPEPPRNWRHMARLHVLYMVQTWLELCPETLCEDEKWWPALRKTGRAWQRECTDGGEQERRFDCVACAAAGCVHHEVSCAIGSANGSKRFRSAHCLRTTRCRPPITHPPQLPSLVKQAHRATTRATDARSVGGVGGRGAHPGPAQQRGAGHRPSRGGGADMRAGRRVLPRRAQDRAAAVR